MFRSSDSIVCAPPTRLTTPVSLPHSPPYSMTITNINVQSKCNTISQSLLLLLLSFFLLLHLLLLLLLLLSHLGLLHLHLHLLLISQRHRLDKRLILLQQRVSRCQLLLILLLLPLINLVSLLPDLLTPALDQLVSLGLYLCRKRREGVS